MSDSADRPLFALERKLGCTWNHLRQADRASSTTKTELLQALESNVSKFATEDANIVVFGSLARREWIDLESDLDWTYFIDGQAKSSHLKIAQQIKAAVERETITVNGESKRKFGEPGPTGTFGNLTFSHQLVHLIGGQDTILIRT